MKLFVILTQAIWPVNGLNQRPEYSAGIWQGNGFKMVLARLWGPGERAGGRLRIQLHWYFLKLFIPFVSGFPGYWLRSQGRGQYHLGGRAGYGYMGIPLIIYKIIF